ncbi:MAG: four-helix bundle copper-binding protein [Nitrosomonadales bacterium SCN 54-20]|nr:MAG: four-helix bundle copper-binding protein [Nitrosomonadales bacterium SCN 54-20]
MSHHLDQNAKDCIAACNDCANECGCCFADMVGKDSPNDCPACCIECAAICRLAADAMCRNSRFAKQICKLCAEICDWCAKECEAHEGESCKRCVEACRRCAEACRNWAGA